MKKYIVIISLLAFHFANGQTSSVTEDIHQNYNSDNFVIQQTKPQSNGDILNVFNQYPKDLVASISSSCVPPSLTLEAQGLQYLVSKNIINRPVETYTSISNSSSTNNVISADLHTYYSTLPYPQYWYKIETHVPLTSFQPYVNSGCGFTKDPNYVLQESYNAYDNYGNLLEKTIKGGKNISFFYGYKGTYKTAVVENASQAQVAYTSFETPNDKGNWFYSSANIVPLPTVIPLLSQIAGNNCYAFGSSGGDITAFVATGNYILSFWGSQNSVTISVNSGGSVSTPLVGTVLNSWTYYEYVLTNVNEVYLTSATYLGTGAYIDELRLYPQNAQMETKGYLPLTGVSYTCDMANHFNYYTYDDLGRLLYIKDQNGNIIKQMEYGIQKPE